MKELNVGQKVYVCTNSPRPPKHHKRKLAQWQSDNYRGEIIEFNDTEDKVLVKNLDSSNAIIEARFWINLKDSSRLVIPKNESVDLFCFPNLLPLEVLALIEKYCDEERTINDVGKCIEFKEKIEKLGYTCDENFMGSLFGLQEL